MPKVGGSTRELIDWFTRVGRQTALKEVLENLRRDGASDVVLAAVSHVIREEERRRG